MKYLIALLLIISLKRVDGQPTDNKITFTPGNKPIWMLTYFRQRYPTRVEIDKKGNIIEVPLLNPMNDERLHIALSTDGRHWIPLNNNKPIWDQKMRDQYIQRGPDGLWRLVATGGDGDTAARRQFGPTCIYATSPDLIHWKVESFPHLMKDVRNAAGQMVRNIWAPEYFYDKGTKTYTLLWSSSFEDAGWKKSRIWYCQTTDWKTFTAAKELFAPAYSVIDGTLIKHGDTYYLFHKEEMFGAEYGERRAIRLATSKKLEGPYTVFEGPLNNGQLVPTITEGPSVMPDPAKKGWLLLYDYPMADRYGISYSADLLHWTTEKNISLPQDARHGSVSRITKAEAEALFKLFPNTASRPKKMHNRTTE